MPADRSIKTFRDLIAWKKAFQLGLALYDATRSFPDHEKYGLTSQLRRGAVSIASNIAEGYGRGSRVDYIRFLKVARGALYELDTQLMFASSLDLVDIITYEDLKDMVDETERVLAGLIRSLEKHSGT